MKKITFFCSIAVLALGSFGFVSAPLQIKGTEVVKVSDCPIEGKWSIVSATMAGETIDLSSQQGVWEFVGGNLKSSSKIQSQTSVDKYTRKGNIITVIESKSGKSQAFTITKCTSDALSVKIVVEGTEMIQNMKKIK